MGNSATILQEEEGNDSLFQNVFAEIHRNYDEDVDENIVKCRLWPSTYIRNRKEEGEKYSLEKAMEVANCNTNYPEYDGSDYWQEWLENSENLGVALSGGGFRACSFGFRYDESITSFGDFEACTVCFFCFRG